MVDLEVVRGRITARLPVRVRWILDETPWDFDFSRAQSQLRPIGEADLNECTAIEEAWHPIYLLGQEDYAEGGGASPFLGVHGESGEIVGLDVERDCRQLYFLNSDVDRYIRTFELFDRVLRLKTLGVKELVAALKAMEGGYGRSEWRLLAEYLLR